MKGADDEGADSDNVYPGHQMQEDKVPEYMQNEYARLLAQGVVNLNTDL